MQGMENETKFKELVLYISQQSASDPMYGSIKLNKILYFSDFFAYAKCGKPITGMAYQKLENGPAPKRFLPIRREMEAEGALGIQEVPYRGKMQKRPVNLRKPNLSVFTAEEISLVDYVMHALLKANAKAVSDISHQMIGWQITEIGEEIPYNTVFLSNEPLTDIEVQRGLQLAAMRHAGACA